MIQARYGWTDEYLIGRVPYARLVQLAEVASKAERETALERWRMCAFIGWQLSGSQKTFGEYLDALGLGERKAAAPQAGEREIAAEEAIKRAEETLARMREVGYKRMSLEEALSA